MRRVHKGNAENSEEGLCVAIEYGRSHLQGEDGRQIERSAVCGVVATESA